MGSRFLSSAEQRYAPIEGEALAAAWALEQTKYFTLGCKNLVLVTDHKPLVQILSDKALDQISNPRIFRLKQRTLPWCFDVAYLPGKTNAAADATSRHPSPNDQHTVNEPTAAVSSFAAEALSHHPSPNGLLTDNDMDEVVTIGALMQAATTVTAISSAEIISETAADPVLSLLMSTVRKGFPSSLRQVDESIAPYWNIRRALTITEDDVLMYWDRVIIPLSLRTRVLTVLHSAHQTVSSMEGRARACVFWPGITADIQTTRDSCANCCRNAPSQPSLPAAAPEIPSTPFESVFADFFEASGHHYLVAGDRLSGWVEVYSSPSGSSRSGSAGLIAHMRTMFATFGVPVKLSSDGGPEFSATATTDFLSRWGVYHRESAAYNPKSNGRAEVAVKTAKRLLLSCIGPSGSLNNDKFLRGILQLRNTPDPECNLSPAQVLFGRPLRDAFSFINHCTKFENRAIHPVWHEAWAAKEDALRTRFAKSVEKINAHARPLANLKSGDKVFIQNQFGSYPNKWDRSGVVLESLGHDQYNVKVDGTGRLTKRNRRFLRQYTLPTAHASWPSYNAQTPPVVSPPLAYADTLPPPALRQPAPKAPVMVPVSSPQPAAEPGTAEQETVMLPSETASDTCSRELTAPMPTPTSGGLLKKVHVGLEPPPGISSRPRRSVKPTKQYDAATGKWV